MGNAPLKYYDKEHGYLLTASQALTNARYRLIPHDDGYQLTELMVCDRPKFNGNGYGLLGPASKRKQPDDFEDLSDEDKAAYIDRSRRRARRAVRDLMDSNRFMYFMTFTLNGERIARDDYAAFVKKVGKYMDNRVQRYGWKYVAVTEYHHDRRNLHLHACVAGDRFNLIDSGTVIRPTGGKPVKLATALRQGFSREQLKTVYNVTDWKDGFSTAIEVYGGRLALTRYILKYITKSESKVGGRWYLSGGNLNRPKYVYKNLPFDDVVANAEFENDGGCFKLQYFDDKEIVIDSLEALF